MAFHAITANVQGGSALERHLKDIEARLGRGAHVRVGFLASATYPNMQEAADNEGFSMAGKNKGERRARNLSAKNAQGGALHVAQVAFWNEFGTKRTPSRPFFRTMIERKSPRWGVALGNALRKFDYDANKAMAIMGLIMKDQLTQSINNWTSPPNAPYTVAKKGFNKPLTDSAVMLRSVDFQVMSGEDAGDD